MNWIPYVYMAGRADGIDYTFGQAKGCSRGPIGKNIAGI